MTEYPISYHKNHSKYNDRNDKHNTRIKRVPPFRKDHEPRPKKKNAKKNVCKLNAVHYNLPTVGCVAEKHSIIPGFQ